jgi:hypothetical protein
MKAERLVVGLRQGIGIAWRFAAAILASFVVAFVVFTLILAGPAWVMMAFIGQQAMADAPAHGGVIAMVTGPPAFIAGCTTWLIMGPYFFRRLSGRRQGLQ